MGSPDPRRDPALLGAWLAAAFALSSLKDPRWLAAALLASALLFRRGLWRNLRRVGLSVVPLTALVSAASWAFSWAVDGRPPASGPFLALGLRAALLAFLAFAALDRLNLLRALAPWPAATRLLVVALAQIHALRLLAADSLLGLRSRLPRRPGTADVLRGLSGITGALLTLSVRNAREVSEALRSRGFE
jgi:cobalt/nickel transport system permease protein